MDKLKNYNTLKKFSHELGLDLFGVADISSIKNAFLLPQCSLDRFDKAISIGARLQRAILEEITGAPTRLYFHHYRTINVFLDQAALKISGFIQKKGFLSLPVPASQILDWQSQKAHLSHKHVGYLAGLGWIGRNNLLVNKEFGSQFRMATILTDIPLKSDKPVKDSCSSSCVRCLDSCPAGAIRPAPGDFEHIKCFEKLKEFQKEKLAEQYICGVCVNACRGQKKSNAP